MKHNTDHLTLTAVRWSMCAVGPSTVKSIMQSLNLVQRSILSSPEPRTLRLLLYTGTACQGSLVQLHHKVGSIIPCDP